MPPKPSTTASPRGRPPGSKNKASTTTSSRAGAVSKSSTATATAKAKGKGKQRAEESQSPDEPRRRGGVDQDETMGVDDDDDDEDDDEEEEEEEPEKSIPPDLLTRILHEFFEKDGTRITKDANNAMAKYMDVFVKEAIARAAAERTGGFLEVSIKSPRNRVTPYETLLKFQDQDPDENLLHVNRLRISKRLLHSFFWICECRALQRVGMRLCES